MRGGKVSCSARSATETRPSAKIRDRPQKIDPYSLNPYSLNPYNRNPYSLNSP